MSWLFSSVTALFASRPPIDPELEALKKKIIEAAKQVDDFEIEIRSYAQQLLKTSASSRALSQKISQFYKSSTVGTTIEAVSTFDQIHCLFDNSTQVIFQDQLQKQVLDHFTEWRAQRTELDAKVLCLELAIQKAWDTKQRILVKEAESIRSQVETEPQEVTNTMIGLRITLAQEEAVLAHMRRLTFELSQTCVDPSGFFQTFDAILMRLIHFELAWFNSGIQLTSALSPLVGHFRQSLKTRGVLASIAQTRNLSISGRPLVWTRYASAEEAILELLPQLPVPVPQADMNGSFDSRSKTDNSNVSETKSTSPMAQVVILTSMVPAPLPNVTLEPAINTDSIDSTRSTVSMDSSGKQSIDKIQESSLVNLSIRDQREEAENPNELSQIAQSERVVITTETSSSVPHFPKGQTINLVSESEPADAKILSWERRLELWEAAGEGHSKPLGSLLNSLQQVCVVYFFSRTNFVYAGGNARRNLGYSWRQRQGPACRLP
jgi:hypothetical protein